MMHFPILAWKYAVAVTTSHYERYYCNTNDRTVQYDAAQYDVQQYGRSTALAGTLGPHIDKSIHGVFSIDLPWSPGAARRAGYFWKGQKNKT